MHQAVRPAEDRRRQDKIEGFKLGQTDIGQILCVRLRRRRLRCGATGPSRPYGRCPCSRGSYPQESRFGSGFRRCRRLPSRGVVCQIKTSESMYGYSEVIPLTSDTAKVLAGAWSTAGAAIAVGLVAYFYGTNSGEQFTSKTISLGGGLQGELSGNIDNGYLTLSIQYPDKTSAIIKLGVTGTYGKLAVESAYGADGFALENLCMQLYGSPGTNQVFR